MSSRAKKPSHSVGLHEGSVFDHQIFFYQHAHKDDYVMLTLPGKQLTAEARCIKPRVNMYI